MGMQIFESSGSFDPAARGLVAGDTIDVICVGGGWSGEHYDNSVSPSAQISPSVAGGESSCGSVSSSSGILMGTGGEGSDADPYAGAGAGGYMPGLAMYGGNGGTTDTPGMGMAGSLLTSPSPYVNYTGDGNKGAGGRHVYGNRVGPGGNGYGAGGGGFGTLQYKANGGKSGKISFGSITLTSTSPIAVTVGAGGVNAVSELVSGAPGVVLVFW